MKKVTMIFLGLVATIGTGCGDGSVKQTFVSPNTSIKPQSQLQFEGEIKRINIELDKATPGTRAREEAQKALDSFWSDKQRNMSQVERWVCVYSNSYPWDPMHNIRNPNSTSVSPGSPEDDRFELLGAFCTDVDISIKQQVVGRGGQINISIRVSTVPNIEKIYYGDVLQVSGAVERDFSGTYRVMPYSQLSYRIWIEADSLRILSKGS